MNGVTSSPYEALASGQRADALAALRALQAAKLVEAEPGQFASLSKEYRATLAELSTLGPAKQSTVDDISAARARRRATPTDPTATPEHPLDVGSRVH